MDQKQSLTEIIKQSQIICAALIMGQLLFLGIAFFILNQNGKGLGDKELVEVLYFVVAALVVGSVSGSFMVFRSKLASLKVLENLQQKIAQYRAAQIIRWALLEGPSFFSIIAYILTGDIVFAVVSIAIIVLFIPTFPSKGRFEKEMELTWEELNQIEK